MANRAKAALEFRFGSNLIIKEVFRDCSKLKKKLFPREYPPKTRFFKNSFFSKENLRMFHYFKKAKAALELQWRDKLSNASQILKIHKRKRKLFPRKVGHSGGDPLIGFLSFLYSLVEAFVGNLAQTWKRGSKLRVIRTSGLFLIGRRGWGWFWRWLLCIFGFYFGRGEISGWISSWRKYPFRG